MPALDAFFISRRLLILFNTLFCFYLSITLTLTLTPTLTLIGVGMYQTLRSQREWRPLRSELVRQMVYEAMPIKIKEIVYVNSPWWMNAFLGTIRRFIPTALSDKLHNVDEDGLYEVLMAGPEDLPAGFCGGTGSTALRYPGF